MNATGPPPVKGYQSIELNMENASKAVEAVKQALRFIESDPPIICYDSVNNRFNPKETYNRVFNVRVDKKLLGREHVNYLRS